MIQVQIFEERDIIRISGHYGFGGITLNFEEMKSMVEKFSAYEKLKAAAENKIDFRVYTVGYLDDVEE
jgi:hypothetical protein